MIALRFKLDDASQRVLAEHAKRPQRIHAELRRRLRQGLSEAEAHLQDAYLRGGNWREKRGGKGPLAVRTGRLVGSTRSDVDEEFSGYVGSANNKYAKVHLGGDTWVMTPKNAKHLWIPIADNLGDGGVPRMSPRAAMDVRTPTGKRALRIFKSKAGNLVAFLPGKLVEDKVGKRLGLVSGSGVTAVSDGRYTRGKNKGRQKGKLLFVLKDQVEVKGTDALANAVNDKKGRMVELLQSGLNSALEGGAS